VLPFDKMSKARLTKVLVDRLEPGDKDFFVWCGRLAGFGVRVWPNGKKTFTVQYRAGGRGSPTRRKSLGGYGTVTVEQARKSAERYLASAHLGIDIVGEERNTLAEMTVSELCDDYILHGMALKKPSTIKTDIGRINGHIRPLLGKKKIGAVTRQDIQRFLNDVANGKTARDKRTSKNGRSIITGGKGTATRTVRLLGGIFTYAVSQNYLDTNPRTGVKLFKDGAKERFLSTVELARLASTLREAETKGLPRSLQHKGGAVDRLDPAEPVLDVMSPHITAAIRLLLLTGCRLREILNLRWNEVDFQRGLLVLPDSKTGRKNIFLSDAAALVLQSLPQIGDYVIAGRSPNKPRSDLKRPWQRITSHAGLQNLRIHDLRHTFASIAAAQGMSLQMIGTLLGHRSTETTSRYAHLTDDPLRRGLNQIGTLLADTEVTSDS